MNIKKTYFWNALGNLSISFLYFFLLIIVVRNSGLEVGGIFNFGVSLAVIFYSMSQYGGRTFQVTNVEKNLGEWDFINSRYLLSFVSIIIFSFFLIVRNYDFDKSLILLMLVSAKIFESFSDVFHGFLQQRNLLDLAGKSNFARAVITFITFYTINLIFNNILISCLLLVVINALFSIIDFLLIKDLIKKENIIIISNVSLYLKKAFSTFILTILILIVFNIPRFVIDLLSSDQNQAIYGILIMPASLMTILAHLIIQPYVVKISLLLKEYGNEKKVYKLLFTFIKVSILISIILIIGTILFGVDLLSYIYDYNISIYTKQIILVILGSLFYLVTIFISTILVIIRKSLYQIYIQLITLIIGIIMTIYLVGSYGIYGAIDSYFFLTIVQLILYIFLYSYFVNGRRYNG